MTRAGRLVRLAGLCSVAWFANGCGSRASEATVRDARSVEAPVGESGAAGSETPSPQTPCQVRVEAVLSSESFRGYPSSPATQRQVEAMSAEEYATWLGESHGASYLLCTYRVIVAGRPWRFEVPHDTSFDDEPPSACDASRGAVEMLVRQTTAECTELHRGAFYGLDLVPLSE